MGWSFQISKMKNATLQISKGFFGFLIGGMFACLVALMVSLLLLPKNPSVIVITQRLTPSIAFTESSATPKPSATMTATPNPPTPTMTQFEQAEEYIYTNPKLAQEILASLIENTSNRKELALAYRYLGDIETFQDHYEIAAVYYEKMRKYQPTAENLLLLAETYNLAGDLHCAHARYSELAYGHFDPYYKKIGLEWSNHFTEVLGHSAVCKK